MKAAVLHEFGSPLRVETVPDPVLGSGEVIVDVVAADVLNYSKEVFSGQRSYLLRLPAIPGVGAIGRVKTIGPDAARLRPGDWVFCDPTVRSRDDVLDPEILLQGWSARGEGGLRLQEHFHDGSWAQQVRVPTENVFPIGPIAEDDAVSWTLMGSFLVPHGGWLAVGLRAGETVVVNGATGSFGAAGVAVALAMGAARVVATGRNAETLRTLAERHGPRLRTVRMTGDEETDREFMRQAAEAPIDCVLDLLPPVASPTWARAGLMALRRGGRAALMGGVGMQGGAGLELPYNWIMRNGISIHGQWMYPRDAVPRMVGMVHGGLLSLAGYEMISFGLDQVNDAVEHAAVNAGPFQKTVLVPWS